MMMTQKYLWEKTGWNGEIKKQALQQLVKNSIIKHTEWQNF